tara:strand:+ start:240 stop:866 length:627 start_codon:yes stop_codon:yes gene_type:complete
MRTRPTKSDSWEARQSVAQLAARFLADGDEVSLRAARCKAAEYLSVSNRALPELREVQTALREYLRLFYPEHGELLLALRETALKAMDLFAEFRPRLAGPVVHGTATTTTPVTLHLFNDSAEEVGLFLIDRDIPHELTERRLRYSNRREDCRPCYEFSAGGIDIELVVFGVRDIGHGPVSPIDGKPMRRLATAALEALLGESPQPSFE